MLISRMHDYDISDNESQVNAGSERRVFVEKMGREENSDGRAFHRKMEEGKNDLVREADLTESGERFRG